MSAVSAKLYRLYGTLWAWLAYGRLHQPSNLYFCVISNRRVKCIVPIFIFRFGTPAKLISADTIGVRVTYD